VGFLLGWLFGVRVSAKIPHFLGVDATVAAFQAKKTDYPPEFWIKTRQQGLKREIRPFWPLGPALQPGRW
jgi:hypothetical protein